MDADPLMVCARFALPMDAEIFAARLKAEGIGAHVMDARSNYTEGFAGGVGKVGIRVMVPRSELPAAERILAAYQAGEFAIDEDFDVGNEPGQG